MTHPALLMLKVWSACILMYVAFPFVLIEKSLTLYGFFLLFLFLGAFGLGTVMVRTTIPTLAQYPPQRILFVSTDTLLSVASLIAIVVMFADLRGESVFDLADAYGRRSDRAAALTQGAASSSSIWFQIGFLSYPAGFVYLVRTIIFEAKPKAHKLIIFGLAPIVLATLSMGGRSPLLYAIVVSLLAFGTRKLYLPHQGQMPTKSRQPKGRHSPAKITAMAAIAIGAMYYFVAVFFARAELFGGAPGMFTVAEDVWGVGFNGPLASFMFQNFGDEFTFIVFMFSWYVVQGIAMANVVFSDYAGPMQFGIYGVDLVSALARRIDGDLVARHFDSLQQLGVYGFFPSAFGSLYVDLWFFGLAISAVWGALASLVYQKVKAGRDLRWLVFAPFVAAGILFSVINTPIGFSNGLVTHFWALVGFLSSKRAGTHFWKVQPD